MNIDLQAYIALLQQLIATESYSRNEAESAALIASFMRSVGLQPQRLCNNVWVKNRGWSDGKPVLLLNSHHDTVQAAKTWISDPFDPQIKDGKLYGLGSNDAGASLVALLAVFMHFESGPELPFNLIYAATAEEEISGSNGIELLLPELGPVDMAIVGEPTGMDMAVAEKGLLVIDCESSGLAGHAARDEGINAIYEALPDIAWFRRHRFEKESPWLGPVKMTVTMIQAGSQHNVVPGTCRFTVDIRLNELYTADDILNAIAQHTRCAVTPRSRRLKASAIPVGHPLVKAGLAAGLKAYGSPTMSDQALLPFPSVKIGPGQSARSHTAEEFIYLSEIEGGIRLYIHLIEKLINS